MWVFTSPVLESCSFVSPVAESWSSFHPLRNPGHGTKKELPCVALSAHTHTHGVLDERGGQRSHAASPQHSLSITTNFDSLVEFFIHPCKFLKYSISFSFNKIKFLLSPKIHDYSLTITPDSPALEVHAKAAPRWLAQRSPPNRPRRAYLLKPPERQVCGF